MGVRILVDRGLEDACLYCSTSMWAFGPVFNSEEQAEEFLKYLDRTDGRDARQLSQTELDVAWSRFLGQGMLKIGDTVKYTTTGEKVKVEGIKVNCLDRDGYEVDEVHWSRIDDSRSVILSLDNGHWAYGNLFEKVKD